jgi:hypothetical protein
MAGFLKANAGLVAVVDELLALRTRRESGTYFIVSADNRQVRFSISSGEVIGLSLRVANLSLALDAIAEMQILRTRFSSDSLPISNSGFGFSTDELIHGLRYRAGRAIPTTLAVDRSDSTQGFSLSPAQQAGLKRVLIEYLGPMGGFVFDEHMESSNSLKELVKALSAEIANQHDARKFLELARDLLRQL